MNSHAHAWQADRCRGAPHVRISERSSMERPIIAELNWITRKLPASCVCTHLWGDSGRLGNIWGNGNLDRESPRIQLSSTLDMPVDRIRPILCDVARKLQLSGVSGQSFVQTRLFRPGLPRCWQTSRRKWPKEADVGEALARNDGCRQCLDQLRSNWPKFVDLCDNVARTDFRSNLWATCRAIFGLPRSHQAIPAHLPSKSVFRLRSGTVSMFS